jgi:hypothetical protein
VTWEEFIAFCRFLEREYDSSNYDAPYIGMAKDDKDVDGIIIDGDISKELFDLWLKTKGVT